MAQIVLQAVGYVVGSMTPIGPALGSFIGSAVGEPSTPAVMQQAARIADLRECDQTHNGQASEQ
jgi:hypothetical protein